MLQQQDHRVNPGGFLSRRLLLLVLLLTFGTATLTILTISVLNPAPMHVFILTISDNKEVMIVLALEKMLLSCYARIFSRRKIAKIRFLVHFDVQTPVPVGLQEDLPTATRIYILEPATFFVA